MKTQTQVKAICLATVGAFALTILNPTRAHAYNYSTHSRIAELAVRAMGASASDVSSDEMTPMDRSSNRIRSR